MNTETPPATNASERETPRTDAFACSLDDARKELGQSKAEWFEVVPARLSRKLEKELFCADRRAGNRWKELDAEKQNHAITKRDLADVQRELAVSNSALNQYGTHFRKCLGEGKCTCGLDAAITTPNYKEELAEARKRLSVLDKQVRQLDQFGSAWKANAEARAEEIERLIAALEVIASYDGGSHSENPGICPYGCDTPHIAQQALAAQNPAGDGDAPWSGKMVSADGLRSIVPPFQQPAPSSVSFVWWSWHPHYPYWSRSCWAGHSVEAAMEHLSNPARKLSAYHNKLIREGGGTLIEVMDVPCVEMENWKRCAEEAEQSAADGSGVGR